LLVHHRIQLYAIVFGFSQQLLTQVVDKQVAGLRDSQSSNG